LSTRMSDSDTAFMTASTGMDFCLIRAPQTDNHVCSIHSIHTWRPYSSFWGKVIASGIATHVGWTVRCLKSSGQWYFSDPSRPVPGTTQPSVQWEPGFSSRSKVSSVWHLPTIPFYCQVWLWVELYLYLTSVPLWHGTGQLYPMSWQLAH
jgi:hypothetical protein